MTTAIGRPTTRSSSGVERYTLRIAVTDALVIIWAVIGAQLVRFGTSSGEADGPQTSTFGLDYAVVAVVLIVLWLVALRVHNAYDPRLFGHGPEEYRAVATATVRLFATLAIVSYLFKLELARGFLLVALPFGLAGLFLARWIWRRWLGAQRAEGRLCDAMVVVGDRGHLAGLIAALRNVPEAGYTIVGACSEGSEPIAGVPIVGTRAPGGPGRRAARRRRRRLLRLVAARCGGTAPARLGARGHGDRAGAGAGDDPGRRAADPHPAGGRPAAPARRGADLHRPEAGGQDARSTSSAPCSSGSSSVRCCWSSRCSSRVTGPGPLLQGDPDRPGRRAVPHVEVPVDGRRTPTRCPWLAQHDGAGTAVQAQGRPADHPARPGDPTHSASTSSRSCGTSCAAT